MSSKNSGATLPPVVTQAIIEVNRASLSLQGYSDEYINQMFPSPAQQRTAKARQVLAAKRSGPAQSPAPATSVASAVTSAGEPVTYTIKDYMRNGRLVRGSTRTVSAEGRQHQRDGAAKARAARFAHA